MRVKTLGFFLLAALWNAPIFGQSSGQKAGAPASSVKPDSPAVFDSATFFHKWGLALCDSGNFRMAILKLKKAVILRRNFPEAWTDWGVALGNVGRTEEEIAKYQEALKIDPRFGEAYFNWGTTLTRLGRFPEAVEIFKKGIAAAPKFTKNYEGLGMVQTQLGQYAEALQNFQKSLAHRQENPQALYWASGCWANLRKKAEALAALEQAIRYGGDYYKMEAKKEPAFAWLLADRDFRKLVGL